MEVSRVHDGPVFLRRGPDKYSREGQWPRMTGYVNRGRRQAGRRRRI